MSSPFYSFLRSLWHKIDPRRRLYYWSQFDRRILTQTGLTVCKGPFKGMKFDRQALQDPLIPRGVLLGTWEQELHKDMEDLLQISFDRVVNIGAAEGYYTVGLLVRSPTCTMVAFETESHWHERIWQLAKLNNVSDRLTVKGFCDIAPLREALVGSQKRRLFVDCEGFEKRLLDPDAIPDLSDSFIVVECHDFGDCAITPTIMSRFAQSHEIHMVFSHSMYRSIGDLPFQPSFLEKLFLSKAYVNAMDEGREEIMHWLIMRPFTKRNNAHLVNQ